MLNRHFFATLLLAVTIHLSFAYEAAYAQGSKPSYLPKDDLLRLLTGNTIAGVVQGIPFQQYFSANGYTVYLPEGGEPQLGQWRVSDKGQVCTLWEQSVMACYYIERRGQTVAWHGPLPFENEEETVASVTRVNLGNHTQIAIDRQHILNGNSLVRKGGETVANGLEGWLQLK